MQRGSREEESERFNHYLKKTYKKTASLIANSCKSVSIINHVSCDSVVVSLPDSQSLETRVPHCQFKFDMRFNNMSNSRTLSAVSKAKTKIKQYYLISDYSL